MDPSEATSFYDAVVERSGLSLTHRCLLACVPSGSSVLEIGPSSGYMTKVLVERGCTVDAIELNRRDAEKAARHCRTLVVGSAEDDESYHRLSDRYDVVLMADVLEHLRSPESALRQARRRLAPDGHAIVSLPNIAYWKMRLDLLRGHFEYKDVGLLDRTHLRFFTLRTAVHLFQEQGLRVEEILVPPPKVRRFGQTKTWVKASWPSLFALQIVYRLRPA